MARNERPQLKTGQMFLKFLIVRLLGRGGNGQVYEVRFEGQRSALKIIPAVWANEDQKAKVLDRASREGQTLLWFKHPNIVKVEETGVTQDGFVWFRMEYLEGHTLREEIQRRGPISPGLTVAYLRQVAIALHQCHVMGLSHLDVKPENIMILRDGRVKLLDFGMAKLYGAADSLDGHVRGTPAYMAPEQIHGTNIGPRSDVYSLGLVAHEMLWGDHIFVEDHSSVNIWELYSSQFFVVPPHLSALGVPAALADIIAKCVEKAPEARYENGLALLEAFDRAWGSLQTSVSDVEPNPGEPPLARVFEHPSDKFLFGTGPAARELRAMAADDRRRSTRSARAASAFSVATTTPMQRRGTPGRAQTVKLPDAERDPTCVRALSERAERAARSDPANIATAHDTLEIPRVLPPTPGQASSETRLRAGSSIQAPQEAPVTPQVPAMPAMRVNDEREPSTLREAGSPSPAVSTMRSPRPLPSALTIRYLGVLLVGAAGGLLGVRLLDAAPTAARAEYGRSAAIPWLAAFLPAVLPASAPVAVPASAPASAPTSAPVSASAPVPMPAPIPARPAVRPRPAPSPPKPRLLPVELVE